MNLKLKPAILTIMTIVMALALGYFTSERPKPITIIHKVDVSNAFYPQFSIPYLPDEQVISNLDDMEFKKDDEIDPSVSEEVEKMASEIIYEIKENNNSEPILKYISYESDMQRAFLEMMVDSSMKNLYAVLSDSQTSIRSRYLFNFENGLLNLPSEYDENLVTMYSFEEGYFYIYNVDVKKHDNHEVLTMVFAREDGRFRLKNIGSGSLEKCGKTSLEWFEKAEKLYEDGMFAPAVADLATAIKCLPPFSVQKKELSEKYMALYNDFLANHWEYFEDLRSLDIEGAKVSIFSISPDYWIDEENYGYAIHYETRLKKSWIPGSSNKKFEKEARLIHEYIMDKEVLDKVGHYTYLPYNHKPQQMEGEYDQKDAIFIMGE